MPKTLDEIYQDMDYISDRIQEETDTLTEYRYNAIQDVFWLRIGRHSFTVYNARKRLEAANKFIEDMTEKYYTITELAGY